MLAFLSRFGARLFARVERTIHSRFDRLEALMSVKSDALMSALADLKTSVTAIEEQGQAKIDAAVAAHEAEDDAAFDAAIGEVRGMISTIAAHADAAHQAADAGALDPATTAAPAPAAPVETPADPASVAE